MSEKDNIQKEQKEEADASASPEKGRLPVLLDLVFDLSNLLIVAVPLIVAGISYVSGASWLDIILRTGISLIVVSVFSIIIIRKIVDTSIEVTNQMLEKASETGTTVDQQG